MTTEVSWLPAHPSYASISMLRYAQLLEEVRQENDEFRCELLINPEIGERAGKWQRQLHRRLLYPLKIRHSLKGRIAHVLDHSWADLLSHVPKGAAKVVTVHDLNPLRFPGELTAAQVARFRSWVEHIRDADAIIADSTYTKNETSELLDIDPESISVVFAGAAAPPKGEIPITRVTSELAALNGRFLVGNIGSILQRKNIGILPDAIAIAKKMTGLDISVVRAGQMLPEKLRNEFQKQLGEKGLIELGHVTNPELEDFYRMVDCICVPSLYEGFGLPVIEAMIRSKPVIVAETSSLPEVGGDAALYFDPHSPEALAKALVKILDNSTREQLITAGLQRVASFTWRNTLEGFYSTYRQLIS